MFKKEERVFPFAVWEARDALTAAVKDFLIAIRVIDIYPEGFGKEAAKRKAENKKLSLLTKIAVYDNAVADKEDCFSSYEIVEAAYRNFKKF